MNSCASAGGRDRRLVDPQDRRDVLGYDLARQFGLKIREPLARAGAAGIRCRRSLALLRSGRSFGRCRRLMRWPAVSREDADHASRAERPGDLADFFVLEEAASRSALILLPAASYASVFRDPKTPRTLADAAIRVPKISVRNASPTAGWNCIRRRRWTNAALADFEKQVACVDVVPAGTEGYEKAEVTAGGVDTDELSAKTMESRKVPGLFFIGEVVDVTGHLGGFNFQWAWASGAAAGRAL